MFNVGGGEILVILLLALLVLGPEKLPETARKVGKFMNEVRRMTSGFEEEVRSAMDLSGLSGQDDAVNRTEDGPRLLAAPPEGPTAITPASPSEPAEHAPTMPATFAADVNPAGSTSGPELVTPPPTPSADEATGDSSAA